MGYLVTELWRICHCYKQYKTKEFEHCFCQYLKNNMADIRLIPLDHVTSFVFVKAKDCLLICLKGYSVTTCDLWMSEWTLTHTFCKENNSIPLDKKGWHHISCFWVAWVLLVLPDYRLWCQSVFQEVDTAFICQH